MTDIRATSSIRGIGSKSEHTTKNETSEFSDLIWSEWSLKNTHIHNKLWGTKNCRIPHIKTFNTPHRISNRIEVKMILTNARWHSPAIRKSKRRQIENSRTTSQNTSNTRTGTKNTIANTRSRISQVEKNNGKRLYQVQYQSYDIW